MDSAAEDILAPAVAVYSHTHIVGCQQSSIQYTYVKAQGAFKYHIYMILFLILHIIYCNSGHCNNHANMYEMFPICGATQYNLHNVMYVRVRLQHRSVTGLNQTWQSQCPSG